MEVPGKPGAYRAVAFLKPHFQLDELTDFVAAGGGPAARGEVTPFPDGRSGSAGHALMTKQRRN